MSIRNKLQQDINAFRADIDSMGSSPFNGNGGNQLGNNPRQLGHASASNLLVPEHDLSSTSNLTSAGKTHLEPGLADTFSPDQSLQSQADLNPVEVAARHGSEWQSGSEGKAEHRDPFDTQSVRGLSEADMTTLTTANTKAREILTALGEDPQMMTKLETAFGKDFDPRQAKALIKDLANGKNGPVYEVISDDNLQAKGAYGNNTIYLNDNLLANNRVNPDVVLDVVLEELGHLIDQGLNQNDALGDEGAIFSTLMREGKVSGSELKIMQQENDHSILTFDNKKIRVENFGWSALKEKLFGSKNSDDEDIANTLNALGNTNKPGRITSRRAIYSDYPTGTMKKPRRMASRQAIYSDYPNKKPNHNSNENISNSLNQLETSSKSSYIVQPGDNLTRIAKDKGTTVDALVDANSIKNPDLIREGQKIVIPNARDSTSEQGSLEQVAESLDLAGLGGPLRFASEASKNLSDPIYPEYSGLVTQTSELSPNMKAFLDTIAYAEGTFTPDGYRTQFAYEKFEDFDDHPREIISANGYDSSASGRYQFLQKTWDGVSSKIDLPDFSPRSQDFGAVELIKQRGAEEDVEAGRISEAITKTSHEWASLPPGQYGQPIKSYDDLLPFYEQQLKFYEDANDVIATNDPSSPNANEATPSELSPGIDAPLGPVSDAINGDSNSNTENKTALETHNGNQEPDLRPSEQTLPKTIEYFQLRGDTGMGLGVNLLGLVGSNFRVETMPSGTQILSMGVLGGRGGSGGDIPGATVDVGDTELGLSFGAEAKGFGFIESGAKYELPTGMTAKEFIERNIVGSLDPLDAIPTLPSIDLWPGEREWRTPAYDPSVLPDPPDRIGTSLTEGFEGSLEASVTADLVGAEFLGPLENVIGIAAKVEGSVRADRSIHTYEKSNKQGYEISLSGNIGRSLTVHNLIKDQDGNNILGVDFEGDERGELGIEAITNIQTNQIEEVRMTLGYGVNDSYKLKEWEWNLNDLKTQIAWEDFRLEKDSLLDLIPLANNKDTANYQYDSTDYGVAIDVAAVGGGLELEHIRLSQTG